jgi:hypothetical protein
MTEELEYSAHLRKPHPTADCGVVDPQRITDTECSLRRPAKASMVHIDAWINVIANRYMQERFLNSTAKRIVIRAGRRGGKTTGMGIRAVRSLLEGRRILYVAPTEPQLPHGY